MEFNICIIVLVLTAKNHVSVVVIKKEFAQALQVLIHLCNEQKLIFYTNTCDLIPLAPFLQFSFDRNQN